MLVQCSILELTLLHCHALESRSFVWALDYDATSMTAVTLVNKILDGQFESDMHCKLVCLPKLYTPSTPNIDLIQWHTHLIVCAAK